LKRNVTFYIGSLAGNSIRFLQSCQGALSYFFTGDYPSGIICFFG
jgi:hypothetical protein